MWIPGTPFEWASVVGPLLAVGTGVGIAKHQLREIKLVVKDKQYGNEALFHRIDKNETTTEIELRNIHKTLEEIKTLLDELRK